MTERAQLYYGGVPVPYAASWTAEEGTHVAPCRHAEGRPSICQAVARGEGKPLFGKPHAQRQREVIAQGLCDLCAKPLKGRTKISLSHARSRMNAAEAGDVLQVEPLLHKECAATSMQHCPSLRRDIREGRLMVRQVTRYRVQIAIMDPIYVETLTGERRKACGHAKVQLLAWVDRDAAWLTPKDPHDR